jgi:hypothetical protein
MRKIQLIIVIIMSLAACANGQSEMPTSYANLQVIKQHSIKTDRMSRSESQRYQEEQADLSNCLPCIVQYMDRNDNIFLEGIFYTDACVGWFKEYYPNGKLKLQGQYTENTSGNWNTVFAEGNIHKQNGQWIYYDESGAFHHVEYWNNGEFIKQEPEQTIFEIWDIKTELNLSAISNDTVDIRELKNIVITPKYKNSIRAQHPIMAKFEF